MQNTHCATKVELLTVTDYILTKEPSNLPQFLWYSINYIVEQVLIYTQIFMYNSGIGREQHLLVHYFNN